MKKSQSFLCVLVCAVLCAVAFGACSKTPTYTLSANTLALNVGDTATLSVSVTPKQEFTCTFASSDRSVATVDNHGLVTALSAGSAVITVTANGTEMTCDVTVSDVVTNYVVSGKVTDFMGDGLAGADVKVGAVQAVTDANGEYTLALSTSTGDMQPLPAMEITKAGFDPVTVDVASRLTPSMTTVAVEEIELVRTPVRVGHLNDYTFTLLSTRSSKGLHLIAMTENIFWSSGAGFFAIWISTKDNPSLNENTYTLYHNANGHAYIHDRGGKATQSFDMRDCAFTERKEGNSLMLEYVIPFAKFGLAPDEVIGLSMATTNQGTDGMLISAADGSQTMTTYTPSYVRIGKDNVPFANTNNYLPGQTPSVGYDKVALTADRPINFALPGVAHQNADDIWLKVTKTSTSFVFDMVGFGSWQDSELIRLTLHTDTVNATAWSLRQSDLVVLCSKTEARAKTGLSSAFDYTSISAGASISTPPRYTQYAGYFTYRVEIAFSEIPGYTANGRVSVMFMEVLNDTSEFYNVSWWIGTMNNGVICGDNAMQANYVVIQ